MIKPTNSFSRFTTAWTGLEMDRGDWQKGQARKFSIKLDTDELNNIKYILEKLSKKSLIGLLRDRKELKSRGERLDHVHPLTFFMGVLSPHCVSNFYDLKARRGMPLDEFVKGAVDSFCNERSHNNITDHQIKIFAQKTERNLQQIRIFVSSDDWNGLIRWL